MSDETGKALEEATDEANGLPGRRSEEGGAGAPERELERLARTVVAGFGCAAVRGSVRSLEDEFQGGVGRADVLAFHR